MNRVLEICIKTQLALSASLIKIMGQIKRETVRPTHATCHAHTLVATPATYSVLLPLSLPLLQSSLCGSIHNLQSDLTSQDAKAEEAEIFERNPQATKTAKKYAAAAKRKAKLHVVIMQGGSGEGEGRSGAHATQTDIMKCSKRHATTTFVVCWFEKRYS